MAGTPTVVEVAARINTEAIQPFIDLIDQCHSAVADLADAATFENYRMSDVRASQLRQAAARLQGKCGDALKALSLLNHKPAFDPIAMGS